MTKKLIAIVIAMAVVLSYSAPAMAYTELKTPVSITATGTLSGVTETFTAAVVNQSTGTSSSLTFSSPSGASDSGKALKINGGSNLVNNRIIIYTDNASAFSTGHDPRVYTATGLPTGADGAGLVGQSEAGYCVPLYWGVNNTTTAGNTPNDNTDYSFATSRDANGVLTLNNATWIVDKGNSYKYVTPSSTLDNAVLYKTDGTAGPVNTAGDGLCPQSWTDDYWTSPTIHITGGVNNTLASMALYKSISTILYGMSSNGSNYTCSVANYANSSAATQARIGTASADAVYIFIGGDFYSKPAQTYTTANLKLAVVQD